MDHMDHPALVELCLDSIRQQYVPKCGLFALRRDLARDLNMESSFRYTAITQIGLRLAERQGWLVGLPLDQIETNLAMSAGTCSNPGNVALALWANLEGSRAAADDLARLLMMRLDSGMGQLSRHAIMELAWMLVAMSKYYAWRPSGPVADVTAAVAREIVTSSNASTGLFPFISPYLRGTSLRVRLYRHFGTFANQSYPIFALAVFHHVSRDRDALEVAERCADQICALQGPLGQWWWLYDVTRGIVAEKYPVFSVHQDGMGPMALRQLTLAGGKDYSAAIDQSWSWVFGANELGIKMIDTNKRHIKRAIQRRGWHRLLYYANILSAMAGLSQPVTGFDVPKNLELVDETRSYHPGWALNYLCASKEG